MNKIKKTRVQFAVPRTCRTKVTSYWWPIPYDKKDRYIPTSVDCLYNQEYFSQDEAIMMLRAL